MNRVDTVIRNGQIVTSEGFVGKFDIGIVGDKIYQIGGEMVGNQVIDASNNYVLPGAIDAHVHLSLPPEEQEVEPRWVDDFVSGSKAALAGGITSIGNMTFPGEGETVLEQLHREFEVAKKQVIADVFFHPVIDKITTETLEEIPELLRFGCNSIKIFTVSPSFDTNIASFVKIVRLAGKEGLITLIHCEDFSLIEDATERLEKDNRISSKFYAESRPVISEVLSTQRAIDIAEATGAPIYIVHLSSSRALELCGKARERGLPVYVETRPLYLHLTKESYLEPDGAKYIGQPPLREAGDLEALWSGINIGLIQTVCTDHAPWKLAAKISDEHNIKNIRPGVADLETLVPLLFSEGVLKARISLARFVQITSTNAAKIFGLFPQKGTIAVGSDADIVIFDPKVSKTIDGSKQFSNSDYSAFDGWEVTGWPVITIRRGEIVFRDGKVLGHPGSGILLQRKRFDLI